MFRTLSLKQGGSVYNILNLYIIGLLFQVRDTEYVTEHLTHKRRGTND